MRGPLSLRSDKPGIIERAYQLAHEGKMPVEIKAALRREGYIDYVSQLDGASLLADLRRIARENSRSS